MTVRLNINHLIILVILFKNGVSFSRLWCSVGSRWLLFSSNENRIFELKRFFFVFLFLFYRYKFISIHLLMYEACT